ncbi:AcrR family transcriptional regulator [Agromyces terreus]|uniref:AcrR family transcriptional regulator n=1 Tax=Agromyces terreus TaxID=424795 RepID=A0A9X2H4D0_9MICO|nr:TetR/AcrR family transcriptional regulator [Agromyces terreus]MCP2370562.1 AcrR family transcriptional regulator [Agromyces terreus]
MTDSAAGSAPLGRRERNKLEKLERITAAARELFEKHGFTAVTTQQVAERADVATGTLFLYAANKAELLLLAQNADYVEALERSRAAAAAASTRLDGVIGIIRPVVECNRKRPENGRAYLRELVFGDPVEPHHVAARELSARTEALIAETLTGAIGRGAATAPVEGAADIARIASAIMLLAMAGAEPDASVDTVMAGIRDQLARVVVD